MREDLKSELLNLQGLEFIYEKSLFPELEYVFKHALTQEVAYNSLLSKRRKDIHKRIGNAIEEIYAGRLEEFYGVLAYHFSKGEELEKAHQYLKLAGEKATQDHALWEAYSFYKEAVELLNRLPDSEEKKRKMIEVIRLMRVPLMFLGFPESSLSFLQQGERLAKELGDTRNLAFIYSGIGYYYNFAGDYLTSIRYTEEVFEEARKAQDVDLMAPLGFALCSAYLATGRYKEFIEKMPEVIHLIEKTGRKTDFFGQPLNPYSHIGAQCGVALFTLGRFDEAKVMLEKALSNAIQVGDSAILGMAHGQYGVFFCS